MTRLHPVYVILLLTLVALLIPDSAYAFSALQCDAGRPVPDTSLYDDSNTGACQFTGIRYIFSTIICQFVTMMNVIMGKLYCSIQEGMKPVIMLIIVVFVAVYGMQMLMGTAQLNGAELVTRMVKMTFVFWLISDPTFGVSAGIAYMFEFFLSFITETTRWVVKLLDGAAGVNLYTEGGYNPGVTAPFKFMDDWIYNSLTGSFSQSNTKVMGFFIAMAFVMPSIAILAFYWWVSVIKMLVLTLIAFLMTVVALSFLLALSPIFLSFMLFQFTFHLFDQWLRFMSSYSLQVMISFAILTLWVYSLNMFTPFFNELADVVYPYHKILRTDASTNTPIDTWGLCPMTFSANPVPSVRCTRANFNPVGPSGPGDEGNQDYQDLIPPTKVPELNDFLFYVFYHMISLLIVSYGFSSLQKNSRNIATSLAGAAHIPVLNIGHKAGISDIASGHYDAKRLMSPDLFGSFNKRHGTGETLYEQMVHGMGKLAGNR